MGWFRETIMRAYATVGRWLKVERTGLTGMDDSWTWSGMDQHDRIQVLRRYYDNNDLYELVQLGLENRSGNLYPNLSVRNPAHQVVEFYVTNLWRGEVEQALPIDTDNPAIVEPIQRVWRWSNLTVRKSKAARWLARDGNLFIKVVTSESGNRVFWQLIDALHVTDFEKDRSGNVTSIRLDIPKVRGNGKDEHEYWYTEVYEADGGEGRYRVWEQEDGRGSSLDDLDDPEVDTTLVDEFGIDFVPFVHAPFLDVGNKWGKAPIEAALDNIDEANRKATRLSKQLFRHNDVTWALTSDALDPDGRPMPAPDFDTEDGAETVNLGGDRMQKLPSGWKLESLVPDLKYEAALAILKDDMMEMERYLPEMTWYRLREQELSGRAIRLKLGEAVSRAEEVQANVLDAVVRANMMALTIGQNAKLEGFEPEVIGTYGEGSFEHTISPPPILPEPQAEKAETLGVLVQQAGVPLVSAMRILKYPPGVVSEVEADIEAERRRAQREQQQASLSVLQQLQAQQAAQPTQPTQPAQPTPPEPEPEPEV